MAAMISISHLCRDYRDLRAVDDLCLTVEEGEIFALLGVNGAGKTTTVKMLSCLLKPTSGDALLGGFSIVTEPDRVKSLTDISMQETAIARNLTVTENLRFYAEVRGIEKETASARIRALFRDFGLGEVADRKGKLLSGGWQRKLSIALALLSEPKILFLDEPTLGLDVLARRELWQIIGRLREKMTVILTTHDMEEAERLSDRVGIMKGGRLLAVGTAEELKRKTGSESFEDAFVAVVTGGESK